MIISLIRKLIESIIFKLLVFIQKKSDYFYNNATFQLAIIDSIRWINILEILNSNWGEKKHFFFFLFLFFYVKIQSVC